jgi:hypothetical protein
MVGPAVGLPRPFYVAVILVTALIASYVYWYFSFDPTITRSPRVLPPPRLALLSATCSGLPERIVCSGVVENISTESVPPLLAVVEWNALHPDDKDARHISQVNAEPLAPGQTVTWVTRGHLPDGARYHIRFKEAGTPSDDFISVLHREGQVATVSQ